MLRRQAKLNPASVHAEESPTSGGVDPGSTFLELELVLDVEGETCVVMHHDQQVLRVDAPRTEGLTVVTVVRADEWRGPGALRVDAPNRIVSAEIRRPITSDNARPAEDQDILPATGAEILELGMGWAPRELVNDAPMRWIGHRSHVHLRQPGPYSKLIVSGIAGPCLGRGGRLDLLEGSRQIDSCEIDIEDGQRFRASFSLKELSPTGRELVLQVERPAPRYTPHDVRVLNLLVDGVVIR